MVDVKITAADREKYRYYTDDSIKGILFIQSLPLFILEGYVYNTGDTRAAMLAAIGEDTNPNWIMSQVAEELYERGDINEREYDRLMED